METARVGVIGGSGVYRMDGLSDVRETTPSTPYGSPSDSIVIGTLEGVRVAFLPRHGRGHRLSPSELPVKANIYALKSLGVDRIISINAVGSLREDICPPDLVVPDQLVDRTKCRDSTFFSNGVVAHIAFADPFCPVMRQALVQAATRANANVHDGGSYVVIEGPQFSTRAESNLYRNWGIDVVGMTALPEARLAREAEICYASLAFVSDYDCWHPQHDSVTTEMIVRNMERSVATVQEVLRLVVNRFPAERTCICATALKDAIVTRPQQVPQVARKQLDWLIGKYM
ncbi:MAG: S-methyl-5'-thioadenosine phosphorylase [Chloroflexota bacterium]